MYNPEEQYRCTIIRGKAQKDLDNLLPFYANFISRTCPCLKDDFDNSFNKELSSILFNDVFDNLNEANQKTVRNHITEIAGKLFGMHYSDAKYTYMSDSCAMLLETGDQPAFFKNICLNFQFPNATQKKQTIMDRANNNINLKPFHYIVSLLNQARKFNICLSKQDIAYYALNSLHVLQGKATVSEVIDMIIHDRKKNIQRPRLSGSRDMQHISEQLNLLELANIIIQNSDSITLNFNEQIVIDVFIKELELPFFDIYSYVNGENISDALFVDWGKYYGEVRYSIDILATTLESINRTQPEIVLPGIAPKVKQSTVELGDEGERFVFEMEKERVKKYKERMMNKVLLLGKIRGIGYDISSIEAEGEDPDFARYIEVKSTTRVTEPVIDDLWRDSINLTAKEWVAAKQYRKYYNIYRVYFIPNKTIVYIINDPYSKYENGDMDVYPTIYQMEINHKHIKQQA